MTDITVFYRRNCTEKSLECPWKKRESPKTFHVTDTEIFYLVRTYAYLPFFSFCDFFCSFFCVLFWQGKSFKLCFNSLYSQTMIHDANCIKERMTISTLTTSRWVTRDLNMWLTCGLRSKWSCRRFVEWLISFFFFFYYYFSDGNSCEKNT